LTQVKLRFLPDSENALGEIAKMLKQNPDVKLSVEGHTDNVGAAAANQTLSEKRAQAVGRMAYRAQCRSRTPEGPKAGDRAKPVADNSGEEGRAKNRRVELVKM